MRRSSIFLALISGGCLVACGLLIHASFATDNASKEISVKKALIREYRLTDLAIFTEARYTRNISMADINTPFQDYPFSFEHFPSGSLTIPGSLKAWDNTVINRNGNTLD